MILSRDVIGCLSLVERGDGRLRVSGISKAYKVAGIDPRDCMDDARVEDRAFGQGLRKVCSRLIELAES